MTSKGPFQPKAFYDSMIPPSPAYHCTHRPSSGLRGCREQRSTRLHPLWSLFPVRPWGQPSTLTSVFSPGLVSRPSLPARRGAEAAGDSHQPLRACFVQPARSPDPPLPERAALISPCCLGWGKTILNRHPGSSRANSLGYLCSCPSLFGCL